MTRRLPSDVERGLWELVARGLVTADGFQALRSLMVSKRRPVRLHNTIGGFRERPLTFGIPSGRWSLLPEIDPETDAYNDGVIAEAWASQLLRRYGVVFRALVQRESMSLPWRDILKAFRRMEARGVIRGGRFVEGFYGEQYALPEAVDSLRRVRRQDKKGETVWLNAVDPLNLLGVATPGARLPAVISKALIYRDGVPEAVEERAGKWRTAETPALVG
jgi:ATP-dependent Lhr-like helicase